MENGKFQPTLDLDRSKRADLAATCATPGYLVQNEIMRSQVDKFVLSLINTPQNDKELVYSNFLLAKAAAQFYQGVVNAFNEENVMYHAALKEPTQPLDGTEGILDIGELASNMQDVPNFLDDGAGDSIIHE